MGIYRFFNKSRGSLLCRVSGVLPEAFLNECVKRGVELDCVEREDAYTLTARAPYRQREAVSAAAVKAGCSIEVLELGGSTRFAGQLRRRAAPAVCILLLLSLLFASRLFIWEIQVVGNETVSAGKILDVLTDCGVDIGSYWPSLTADLVRSQALVQLPELSWLTVNIYGSRAEVVVRERVAKPEMLYGDIPTDIVADKTGVVDEVLALVGTAEVRRGSAVAEGDRLISGGVENRMSEPNLVCARGSIRAYTYYEISACIPVTERVKVYTGEVKSRWSLVIGEERLNFYGNSSIYDAFCDKINSVWKLAVDGLFQLPIRIEKVSSVFYELEETERDKREAREMLEEALHARLLEAIGEGGEILDENYSASEADGLITVCLRARCREDIGVSVAMSDARMAEIQENYIGKGEDTND